MLKQQLFAKKSLEVLKKEMEGENRLRRVLGPIGLTSLGVGAIIGAGIFVTTGEAAANKAGPAVMLSFAVAGLGCAFAALCYAEFAAMAPVAGSAYTYAYATLGELFAWIIGWDLVLEYAMSCGTLAADWTKYFNELLEICFGKDWRVPAQLSADPWTVINQTTGATGWLNLPAVVVMALCTIVLVIGIRESVTMNAVLVGIKLGVVLFVIGVGCWYINPANWTSVPVRERKITDTRDLLNRRPEIARLVPEDERAHVGDGEELLKAYPQIAKVVSPEELTEIKGLKSEVEKWGAISVLGINHLLDPLDERSRTPFMPYGWSGIMVAAAAVFFAFIGFDSISTHAEEAKRPQRDVPFGIIASLALCTVLYFGVSAVITGMQPYPKIDENAAVAVAFKELAKEKGSLVLRASAGLIAAGAVAGITSVILITFLSQARRFLAIARDGLLPIRIFGAVHPRFRTPHLSTILTGSTLCLVTAFTPIHVLFNMVNIGTLLAFVIVCAAVLLLRIRRPDVPRPFRCPAIYVLAPLGIFVNLLMMMFLPLDTWIRLFGWLGLGLVIYLGYSYRHTTLGQRLWAQFAAQRGVPAEVDYYRSRVYRRRASFALIFCSTVCALTLAGGILVFVSWLVERQRLAEKLSIFEVPITVWVFAGLSVFMIFMVVANFLEWKKAPPVQSG
jgi:APA family basic amino acid/polyamine antiporter